MKTLKKLAGCVCQKYYAHYDGDHPVLRFKGNLRTSVGMRGSPEKNGGVFDVGGDVTVPVMLILHIALLLTLTATVCSAVGRLRAYIRCRARLARRGM